MAALPAAGARHRRLVRRHARLVHGQRKEGDKRKIKREKTRCGYYPIKEEIL
jgi:hypothetical protein